MYLMSIFLNITSDDLFLYFNYAMAFLTDLKM